MNRYQTTVLASALVFAISAAGVTSIAAPVAMGVGSVNATGIGISGSGILGMLVSGATFAWGLIKSGSLGNVGKLIGGNLGDVVQPIMDRVIGGEKTTPQLIAADVALGALGAAILTRRNSAGVIEVDQEALRLLGLLSKRINGPVDAVQALDADSDPQALFDKLVGAVKSQQVKTLQGSN